MRRGAGDGPPPAARALGGRRSVARALGGRRSAAAVSQLALGSGCGGRWLRAAAGSSRFT